MEPEKQPDKLTEWGRLFCSCGCLLVLIPVAIVALMVIWALLTGE